MTKILIVDDQKNNLYLLQVLLSSNGYEVESASNGAEALELALQATPDVIISDILMPVMDGFSLCRTCKEDKRLRDIPFIFYTATYTEPKDEALALSLGAERFLIKPTEPAQFLALLKETVEKFATIKLAVKHGTIDDAEYLKEHHAALTRKLEDKVAELEAKNRRIEADNEAQKKVEKELHKSQKSYALLVDNAPSGIYRAQDGVILLANQELANIANCSTPADLIGQQSQLLYQDPSDQARMLDALSKEKKVKNFETRFLTRDGQVKAVLLSASVEDGSLTCIVTDITDQKQVKVDLKKSEEWNWTLLSAVQDYVYVLDQQHCIEYVNDSGANFLRMEIGKIIGKSIHELFPPEAAKRLEVNAQRVFEKGEPLWETNQFPISSRDFWLSTGFFPIRSVEGSVQSVMGVARDITAQKENEEKLRRSDVLLNITGKIAKIGGWEIILEPQKLNWTEEVYRIHEVDPDTQVNVAEAIKFYPPESQPLISAAVQACIASGTPWDLELQMITAKGKSIWVHTLGLADRSHGTITRIYGTSQDITERKLVEDQLRQSEERYRQISNVVSDYVYSSTVGADGRLSHSWIAGAFENISGYTFEEYNARGGWRSALHPDDREIDDRDMEKLCANQSTISELRTIHKSGKIVWVRVYAYPVWDAKLNKLTGISGAVQDITERKQAEELIHQRTQDLELINAINSAINQGKEIDDVLRSFSNELLRIFHFSTVVLAVASSDENYLEVEHIEFPSKQLIKIENFIRGKLKSLHLRIPITGDGQFARICKQREIEVINDPATIQALFAEYVEEEWQKRLISQAYKIAGIHYTLPLPLVVEGKILGLFQIGDSEPISTSTAKRIRVIADHLTTALARKYAEHLTSQRLKNIEALHTIDHVITNSMDLRLTLKVVVDETIQQLGVDAANIFLFEPDSNLLESAVSQGFRTTAMQKVSLRIGEGIAGRIASDWKRIFIADMDDYRGEFTRAPLFTGEDFVTYCGLPLRAKGYFIGVFEVFNRKRLNPGQDWFGFLETLAGQAAIAIDSIRSFEKVQLSNTKLILAYDATIEGWSRAMDLRDKETEGHTQRVTKLTVQLARNLGVDNDQIVHIRRGALLHDMGKLGVPDQILLKPDKLTDEERVIMRNHPQYAYDMLSSITYLRPALEIPYCHHEKWDGSGYPRGLKGEEIPLAARIFAVIDVWDALTSDRPYRKAWTQEQTLEYVHEQSGTHFDPAVVVAFENLINR